MPVIKLEFDDAVVSETQAQNFCRAIRAIVIKATDRPEAEVCVYGNASQYKLNVAPIQVWLEISDYKVRQADALADEIRQGIAGWKAKSQFEHQIKFTLMPIAWKVVRPV